MLDVYAARQGYKEQCISNIGFVQTKHNVAYALTKTMNQEAPRYVITTWQLSVKVQQWIIRKS